jgi:hypothetical protein
MPGSGTLTPAPHAGQAPAPQTGQGTLLGVLPVNGGSQHLAIVGYLPPSAKRLALPTAPAGGDGLVVEPAQRRVLAGGRDTGLVFR